MLTLNCAQGRLARRLACRLTLLGSVLAAAAPAAQAHTCGSSNHQANLGEAFAFTIWADVVESSPTDYTITGAGDANVARVATPPSFSSLGWGSWGMLATGVGTTTFTFHWAYTPNAVAADCVFQVTVVAGLAPRATRANYLKALALFDPVSTATGEFYFEEQVRLGLPGPLPIEFELFYGSHLLNNRIFESRLGNNWLHSYDLALIHDTTAAEVHIQFRQGRVLRFQKNGAAWDLVSPTDVPFQLVESGGGFVLGDPWEHLLYSFDSVGKLTTIADGKGNTQTLSYIGGPALSQVSDGLGHVLTFSYDSINLLIGVSDGQRSLSFTHAFTIGGGENLASVSDALGNTTTYQYDFSDPAAGRMTSRTRPGGNTPTTQTYDAKGRVVSQTDGLLKTSTIAYAGASTTATDPLSQTQTHSYDASGAVTSIQDEAGSSIAVSYDADGQRSGFTDRTAKTAGFTYHAASGKVATATRADGTVTTFSYASRTLANGITFYDLTGIAFPDGSTESYVYDAQGNLTSAVGRRGGSWTYSYNARGQLVTQTNPLAGVVTNSYNASGTLASQQTADGLITTFGYDTLDRIILRTLPGASTEVFAYDANDNVVSYTDQGSRTSVTSFDANGNPSTVTGPDAKVVSFSYDALDRLISVNDQEGNTLSRTLDALGRVSTITEGDGNAVSYGYDLRGRLVTSTDDLGAVERRGYDAEGIITSQQSALGDTKLMTTDNVGRYLSVVTPAGHTRSISYDTMGRIANVVDPSGATTSYAYDSQGQLASVSLPEGIIANYSRNATGQITSITDPRGFAWTYSYDAGARRTSAVDPLGNTTSYGYDSSGRLSQLNLPAGGLLTIAYDSSGHVISRSYDDGTTINYGYDGVGRLDSGTAMSRTYDGTGRLVASNGIVIARTPGRRIASMQLALGKTVTYVYDAAGRVTQVSDWNAGAVTLTYDAAGRLTAINRPNGVGTSYVYDADDNLTQLNHGTIAALSFSYVSRGHLETATRNLPLAPPLPASSQENLSYDAASQVASFSYDGLGQLTNDGTRSYGWNLAGELMQTVEGPTTTDYAYDAVGNRVSRTRGAVERHYVWNYALEIPAPSIIRDASSDLAYYVHTPDGLLLYSIDTAGNRFFYHYDGGGNTIAITNDAGTVVASYAYTPFGRLAAATGTIENPFTWQGRLGVIDDGGGLYSMRARYYDSETGRFLTRDPDPSVGPRNLNPYMYALDDPIGFSDPSGVGPEQSRDQLAAGGIDGLGLFGLQLAEAMGVIPAGTTRAVIDSLLPPYLRQLLRLFEFLGGAGSEPAVGIGDPIRDPKKGAGKKVSFNLPGIFGLQFAWIRIPVGDGRFPPGVFNPGGFEFDGEGRLKPVTTDTLDTSVANGGASAGPSLPASQPGGGSKPGAPGQPDRGENNPANLQLDPSTVANLNDLLRGASSRGARHRVQYKIGGGHGF